MHIIHFGKYYAPALGGMESLIRSQAIFEANTGHKVEVVVVNHQPNIATAVTDEPTTENSNSIVRLHRVATKGCVAKCDIANGLSRQIKSTANNRPDIWNLQTPNATKNVL